MAAKSQTVFAVFCGCGGVRVQVISCRLTTDVEQQVLLRFGEDVAVQFTYSVAWQSVSVSVHDRLLYHVRRLVRSQPLEVHWLSTLNSFILVILVTAFVALVFTTILRQDCARYHEVMLMTRDDVDSVGDPGWKQLQRDVFRAPTHCLLFCAVIGTGTQLLVLSVSVLLLSLIGTSDAPSSMDTDTPSIETVRTV